MEPIDLKTIDVLLFDLGNVVIEIDFERALARWAADSGVPVARLRERFTFDGAYEAHERGEIEAPAYFDSLRRQLGLELDDACLAAGWNEIYVGTIGRVAEVLPSLARRRRLAAFTNTNVTHHEVWSARFAEDLRPFEAVYLSCALGRRKPELQAYGAVAEALGVAPSRILFFDDVDENVDGARAAGMAAVQVRTPTDVLEAVGGLLP